MPGGGRRRAVADTGCRWRRARPPDGRGAGARRRRHPVRVRVAGHGAERAAAEVKSRFYAARSEDAIQTRAFSGKPCRVLKSDFTEAWAEPGAPKMLPMPLQTLLAAEAKMRFERARDP